LVDTKKNWGLKFMAMPPKQPAFAIHSESKHEKGPEPEHSQGLCLILSEISKGDNPEPKGWMTRDHEFLVMPTLHGLE
jgi:hypothetical protein